MNNNPGWIGVDLDGTLAEYNGWKGPHVIGAPVPMMLDRVKAWLLEGKRVKIFTARVYCPAPPSHAPLVERVENHARRAETLVACAAIEAWCQTHLGTVLEITCVKDFGMIELWDDRAWRVELNTGRVL